MGKWALLPADVENWMTEETSDYFRRLFGLPKGLLHICTLDDGYEHVYVPISYIKKLHAFITETTRSERTKLEQVLRTFYSFKRLARKNLTHRASFARMSTQKLISLYRANRHWAHRATVYDQFGWLGEDYWTPLMEKILVRRCGTPKDSPEYYRVLFTFIKPEEISTTLEEKRAVLDAALSVKARKESLANAARTLARAYGWMPVFTFGEPWDEGHYAQEIRTLQKRKTEKLQIEYDELVSYREKRNTDIAECVRRYDITKRDLQTFIDFGLALDTRNEAEYIVSYAGFYLLPIYREIARRLGLSVKQLRTLYEDEIVSALKGTLDPQEALRKKGTIIAWGFDRAMKKRKNFSEKESQALFEHIESYVKPIQGSDESRGVCGSPGSATGTARIVKSPSENGKVKKGDILVTYATTVDYLPAMKRASAFITEVGGLTCHAAVVAREFGVPCIVGLKNAMTAIQDGARVEVIAEKGIVKIA